jgi:hypothetical protein
VRLAAAAFGLALLLAARGATAQENEAAGAFPQIAGEIDMGLLTLGNPRATDPRQRGSTSFLFGEIATGLYVAPQLSVQSILHVEPVGEQQPNGSDIFFRYQAAYLESLSLDWRATERLRLFAGKFTAPFGYGHHAFPGVLARFRAHEIYMIRESVGAGATVTWLSDARLGEHDISFAAFFLDTSFLSNTAMTRKPCCIEGFDRYRRNTLQQGGAGNTGNLDNAAIALDGDRIGWLPNFTYHLAGLTRAAGKGGTRREWGIAVGARYRVQWAPEVATLFFGEYVQFWNAGGRPLLAGMVTPDEATGEPVAGPDMPLTALQRFSTLGAQTSHGPWRATAIWQVNQERRSVNPVPTQQWLELTLGRDLLWGFGLDIGYQYAVNPGGEASRGTSHGIVSRLGFLKRF